MTKDELVASYISAPEIAKEMAVTIQTVHNWLRFHRYMPHEEIFKRRVVLRTEFERFKREHPELIQTAPTSAEATT